MHLRDFLMKTHTLDLVESTKQQHYEAFRSQHKKKSSDKKAAAGTSTKSSKKSAV